MLTFNFKMNFSRPDIKIYQKKLHERMVALWMGAVDAFIFKLATEDIIKVDTGMSKASLIPLSERLLMGRMLRLFIQGKRGPRLGYTDLSGAYHAKEWKSKAHGERLGQKAFTLKTGSPGRSMFEFTFKIVVYQWAFHEVRWRSIPQAEEAFMQFIDQNWEAAVPELEEAFA